MTDQEVDRDFAALLEYLKRSRGFDFTGYKPASLLRRINKRMETVGVESFADYMDYLEVHPDEFAPLFNFILINVTSFFRDSPIWEYVGGDVIPRIINGKDPDDPIRVWCAGVASGQEAYTVAMLLAERLGPEQFGNRAKIYGTDVDEEALNQARQAVYSQKDLEAVPEPLRAKYFEESGTGFVFKKEFRRAVIFGRHDLVQDAPISRVDLMVCRNTLMYLNAETQARVLAHLRFALREGGYLLLGKAEMLFTTVKNFQPVDLKRRVFLRPVTEKSEPDRLFVPALAGDPPTPLESPVGSEAAFDAGPVAQVVVDRAGTLVMANERARSLFGLSRRHLGRPFRDLEMSYRPLELRSRIGSIFSGELDSDIKEEWLRLNGENRVLRVEISPLEQDGGLAAVSITFEDVTRYRELQEELEHSNQELETAMEELQSTNEELETTNEELQSTNEELETTNEELQSTNEELETMNEELQSMNEELQTVNQEFQQRSGELGEVNTFLESILTSVRSAVVVLDSGLRVREWNREAENMWGLRADEVKGQPFMTLDFGLPVEMLKNTIRATVGGNGDPNEVRLKAVNRRGHGILCRVTCGPLVDSNGGPDGVILMMEEDRTGGSS